MKRRTKTLLMLFATILIVGTTGYKTLLGPQITLFDSFYMTIITISTVGFTEVVDLSGMPWVRLFTVVLLFFGMGNLLLLVSTLTSSLVEGDLNEIVRRRRMLKKISKLEGHLIICGVGKIGMEIITRFTETSQVPVVAIDTSEELVAHITQNYPSVIAIHGDATDDMLLEEAGIKNAAKLVVCVPDDSDSVFITMAARQLNPSIHVIASYRNQNNVSKLKRAGANEVISPNRIGGRRMVSMILQPTIVDFLDYLMDHRSEVRLAEVPVPEASWTIGKNLKDLKITNVLGLQVIGAKRNASSSYEYCPSASYMIQPETSLVVVGNDDNIQSLKEFLVTDSSNK